MLKIRQSFLGIAYTLMVFFTAQASANLTHSVTGVGGYDLVSYHQESGPVRGDGSYVTIYNEVSYLFASAENKAEFDADPDKFLPAYGGFCAYGVSVNKKFHVDPLAWRVEDGKLYLNLNKKVQGIWLKDVPGNIEIANVNWQEIKDTPADQL